MVEFKFASKSFLCVCREAMEVCVFVCERERNVLSF